MDQTYSFHHMLIGEIKEKYLKIFEDEEHLYKMKDSKEYVSGNGVKIDQITVRDLKYCGKDEIAQSTLYRVIGQLKQWVVINQLCAQCFDQNYKKWQLQTEDKLSKQSKEFELRLRELNGSPCLEIKY